MRIIRFIDETGTIRLGQKRGDGTATVLRGDLFAALEATDQSAAVTRLLAPLEPINIFAIGLNYGEHARETGAALPENPVLFMKPTTALNDPEAPIVIPAACDHGPEVDYEAELAVIIGRTARNVPTHSALDYVFGYTCANDVSARRWQKHGGGGQWVRGKSFDGFCPLGPELVTRDELSDPQNLTVRCYLNGECMQDGNTNDMIFPVAELISFLSRDTTLLPGTVILTGTPPGVGFARTPPVFLQPGDRVVIEIENIGRLENPVAAAGA